MAKAEKANNGWGGKREGAGSKPRVHVYSDALKKDLTKALKELAIVTGKSYGQVIAATAYGYEFDAEGKMVPGRIQDTVRLGAQKLVAEILVVKKTETDVEVNKVDKPIIYLPETMSPPDEGGGDE